MYWSRNNLITVQIDHNEYRQVWWAIADLSTFNHLFCQAPSQPLIWRYIWSCASSTRQQRWDLYTNVCLSFFLYCTTLHCCSYLLSLLRTIMLSLIRNILWWYLQERSIAESSSASARALNPSLEGMSWQKVTRDLITQVMEGLRSVPMPSSDNSSATQVREHSPLVLDVSIPHLIFFLFSFLFIYFFFLSPNCNLLPLWPSYHSTCRRVYSVRNRSPQYPST